MRSMLTMAMAGTAALLMGTAPALAGEGCSSCSGDKTAEKPAAQQEYGYGDKDKKDKKASKANIVETASSAGKFSTLLTAAKKAGLAETLSDGGPFTVFAPTDEAFSKLPDGTVQNLLDNPEQLKQVLLYHVLDGKVKAKKAMKTDEAKTLQGQTLQLEANGKTLMINNAKVIMADVMASNGVIHAIDTVLLPSAKPMAKASE